MAKTKCDPIQELVDMVVDQLEAVRAGDSARPEFLKAWAEGRADHNGESKHVYRGFNSLRCAVERMHNGWRSRKWWTSRGIFKRAGWVEASTGRFKKNKKGERYELKRWTWPGEGKGTWPIPKGTPAVPIMLAPHKYKVEEENEDTGEKEVKWFASRPRYVYVFNSDVVKWGEVGPPEEDEATAIEEPAKVLGEAQELWDTHGFDVRFGSDHAAYFPITDHIEMPEPTSFMSPERYYAVLFHEGAHATGAAKRLDREGITGREPSRQTYALEELVAEMASAGVCFELGISNDELIHQSGAYLLSWLRALRDKPARLVSAASKAHAAMDWLLGREAPTYEEDD